MVNPGDDADLDRFDNEAIKHLIGHADRMWRSEEQNAARIATRANLVLTAVAAIIGLKVFTFGKELDTIINAEKGLWFHAFIVCLLVAAYFLIHALCIAIDIRPLSVPSSSASSKLEIEEDLLEELLIARESDEDDNPVGPIIISSTMDAASNLRDRNASRERAIGRAQILFFAGVLSTFATFFAYTMVKIRYTSTSHESNAITTKDKP